MAGSLREDVFLLAHDDDGRLIVPEPVISAGLAGAVLLDLLVDGRVAVVDGRLDVINAVGIGDAETDTTLEAIAANTDPTGPRAWVSWISADAYERIATGLEDAGVVKRSTVRRLRLVPVARWVPTNPEDLVRLRSRLRFGLHSADVPDARTAALAGLVRVLRLQSSLLLSMPTAELLAELDRLARNNPSTVRQVIRAVDAVVTAATYR